MKSFYIFLWGMKTFGTFNDLLQPRYLLNLMTAPLDFKNSVLNFLNLLSSRTLLLYRPLSDKKIRVILTLRNR